ncbi:MAG: tryptophan synthase subunit alpha [Eubacteriales bacterium]|nr:tryptophan synthase subunit alpha [Eubacteriales bacterium]
MAETAAADKIRAAFAGGKAFIPFITCGDPDLETTKKLVKAAEEAGADIIELGVPFSDPTAEGPVIQGANIRALSGGVTTDKIFDMVAEIRGEVKIPLVFMTYANVVYSYGSTGETGVEGGTESFVKKAAEVGINGIILPDVPYEEKEDFAPICKKYGLSFISLIAPTSQDRIRMIAADADGFVYCVSSLGVTGVRAAITTDIGAMVKLVREASDIPVAIGFGISTPETAAAMAEKSDGVIVGSAIVKIIAQYGRDAVPHVAEYIRSMKDAIR